MSQKIKIGVLHGAISNAGDFLIYERGKKLLKFFFDDDFYFTYKLRSKSINGDFDGLIILGGPLITRKLHPQSKNIIKYIRNKNIPCVCVGLGISGVRFDFDKNYFLDCESINFWKYIYESSKLFSVRDKITNDILKNYNIEAALTGCPALFDSDILEKGDVLVAQKNKRIDKIAITIPNLLIRPTFSSVRSFLLTLCFLFMMRRKFNKKGLGLFFQHGYANLPNKFIQKLANIVNVKVYDVSGESLDSVPELSKYDLHIGTRLHSHIYFLSLGKPSFLLDVNMRTEAFLKTIKTPCDKYTINGILNLVNMLKKRIGENNFKEFDNVFYEIGRLYTVMKNFLNKINLFFKEGKYEDNKN